MDFLLDMHLSGKLATTQPSEYGDGKNVEEKPLEPVTSGKAERGSDDELKKDDGDYDIARRMLGDEGNHTVGNVRSHPMTQMTRVG